MKKKDGWFENRGDETLALDWPIHEFSYVLEIGGYKGRWAMDMFAKYRCHIDIFEPQHWAATEIDILFENSIYMQRELEKVELYDVALWDSYGKITLYDAETDGGTLVEGGREGGKPTLEVQTIDAHDFLRRNKYDVVLMNIEGGEYTLLPYLCKLGIIKQFSYFWMQHHHFADPTKEKMDSIRKMMLKTHEVYWEHGSFICWRRKDDNHKDAVEN